MQRKIREMDHETEEAKKCNKELLKQKLEDVDEKFGRIVESIPPRTEPYLPPYWLHLEIIERYKLLNAAVEENTNVLEVGCGAHALSTVPLAYMVGNGGRVIAVDVERWNHFDEIIGFTGFKRRVIPVSCDATSLPFKFKCFDLGVIIHGIRSMHNEDNITKIIKEMLRVSSQIFIAESLPIAKTKAQEAHLEMYNLREEIFEALEGRKDGTHYIPLKKIEDLVRKSGGTILESKTIDTGLPDHLAFLPKNFIEKIKDQEKREDLLNRWKVAYSKLKRYGKEHLPVGIIRTRT